MLKLLFFIRLLSKRAAVREMRGEPERRTGVYTLVHEDSSTISTKQFSTVVAFRKKFIFLLCVSLSKLALALPLSDPRLIYPLTENKLRPSPQWLQHIKPYPTNAWFTNFIMQQKKDVPSEPVNIFPYLAQISLRGLALSYTAPIDYIEANPTPFISAVYYQFEKQLTIGTLEPMLQYGVDAYHGSKINLQWRNNNQQGMTIPIMQGAPYVTSIYANTTPMLRFPFKIIAINEHKATDSIASSQRFKIVLARNKRDTQTWLVYAEKPIRFIWKESAGKTILSATQPYSGWLRCILQKDSQAYLDNSETVLDAYSQAIPLDYEQQFSREDAVLTYTFFWQTQNSQKPLMLSLPHQRPIGGEFIRPLPVVYQGIKGLMVGEGTFDWEIHIPRVPIIFLETKKLTIAQRKALQRALKSDIQDILARPFPDDSPYQVGKRLTRAARLLLIADALSDASLKQQLLVYLKKIVSKKMLAKTKWYFQYDTVWGGIIPSMDDYGARHYNDHHYHYGYWVYAIAVLGKFDPDWLNNPLPTTFFSPKDWTDILVRDFANNRVDDPYFPPQRHQEDYVGHSWASGLTAFKDGQNQQSSSEAVHAYYAVALYALVTNDTALYHWAELLMTREIKAAQLYWQIASSNPVYSKGFISDNKVIANLWDSKVDTNAFFIDCKIKYRCGLEYSYGIEMLPFTAISKYLLNKVWLQETYPLLIKLINHAYGTVAPAWKWILIKGMASVLTSAEQKYYFNEVVNSRAEEYDNGDSKTNTLYFLVND